MTGCAIGRGRGLPADASGITGLDVVLDVGEVCVAVVPDLEGLAAEPHDGVPVVAHGGDVARDSGWWSGGGSGSCGDAGPECAGAGAVDAYDGGVGVINSGRIPAVRRDLRPGMLSLPRVSAAGRRARVSFPTSQVAAARSRSRCESRRIVSSVEAAPVATPADSRMFTMPVAIRTGPLMLLRKR